MTTDTDRELLELAAKAAGLVVVDRSYPVTLYVASDGCCGGESFNPLSDDGDALRLAVVLGMNVFHAAKSAYALPSDADGTYEEQVRYIDAGSDPYAATRRAIVRAAAEIGRGME